jgi:hypothetical protein
MNTDLKKQLASLTIELQEMLDFHYWAANSYGSELCAGDMQRKEKDLRLKIQTIEMQIAKSENENHK